MCLLVTSEILGLLINTLTTNEKYTPLNNENLPQPIPIQLSKKYKKPFWIFALFLKSTSNLKHSEKKDYSHRLCIFEITDSETSLTSKESVSEHPLTVNMLKCPKHWWNLEVSVFYHIVLWLLGKLIWKMSLFVISEMLGLFVPVLTVDDRCCLHHWQNSKQPIQKQLSKKINFFLSLLSHFWHLHQIFNILKQRRPSYLMYFWN